MKVKWWKLKNHRCTHLKPCWLEIFQHCCQGQIYIELPLHYLHILYYTERVFAQILNKLVAWKSENLIIFNIKSQNSTTTFLNKHVHIWCVKKIKRKKEFTMIPFWELHYSKENHKCSKTKSSEKMKQINLIIKLSLNNSL